MHNYYIRQFVTPSYEKLCKLELGSFIYRMLQYIRTCVHIWSTLLKDRDLNNEIIHCKYSMSSYD
jgi:hypothetical protein